MPARMLFVARFLVVVVVVVFVAAVVVEYLWEVRFEEKLRWWKDLRDVLCKTKTKNK